MSSQQVRSLGIIKNRFNVYKNYKDQKLAKLTRFKKNKNLEQQSLLNNSGNGNLNNNSRSTDTRSEESTIQQLSDAQRELPFVKIYYDTLPKLDQVRKIFEEVKKLGAKRKLVQFEKDQLPLDQKLHDLTVQATKMLKESEMSLKQIKIEGDQQQESKNDAQVRTNLERNLALQISELTQSLRKEQKKLFDYLKQINSTNSGKFLQLSQNKMLEMQDDDNEEQMHNQSEVMELLAQDRDEQINQLVSAINELTTLFKTLSEMVIEQGTILDRIDFNIQEANKETKLANKQLNKANEYHKSGCARKCTMILITCIVIFAILLVIKWTH